MGQVGTPSRRRRRAIARLKYSGQIRHMPIPMLKVLYISSSATPPMRCMAVKTGGTGQEPFLTRAAVPAGSTLGRLPGRPEPVMCARARTTFLTRYSVKSLRSGST